MKLLRSAIITGAMLCFSFASFAFDTSSGSGTGTVAETIDSAGYTYVLLEEDGRWVAGPPTEVAVGDKITYGRATEMGEFHSRSLDRTFEQIIFAQSLTVIKPTDADAHANSTMNTMIAEQLGITKSEAAVTPDADEIVPLDGGMTINAIRTQYEQLNGKKVALKARVMKVSENILGKNWITLQDGTGVEPDDKLLATSAELVDIGDMVTATGTIKTDVDLGSGYKYKVVMEETVFTKQP